MEYKILILDDHKVFSESIKTVLESQNYLVKNANDANLALKYLQIESYDLIITDIEMPNVNGIDFLKNVKKIESSLNKIPKYIVLTSITKISIFKQLLNIGIDGYLSKNVSQIELTSVLKKVLKGEKYYEKTIYDTYLKENKNTTQIDFTKRELEVLRLILDEKTTAEIAEELEISAFTVEGHRKNLLQKTNSKNVVGLIKYAIQNNL